MGKNNLMVCHTIEEHKFSIIKCINFILIKYAFLFVHFLVCFFFIIILLGGLVYGSSK